MCVSGCFRHLSSVHWAWSEGCVREGLCGAQQVAHTIKVMLVLFNGLDAHPVLGKQGLIAGGITWGRQELEVAMTATQKESSPAVGKAISSMTIMDLCSMQQSAYIYVYLSF